LPSLSEVREIAMAAIPRISLESFASAVTGVVFLGAPLGKTLDPIDTVESLRIAIGVKPALVSAAFYALVCLELLLASMLLTGVFRRAVLMVAATALIAFIAWMLWLYAVSPESGCGRGLWILGGVPGLVLGTVQNLALLTLIIFAVKRPPRARARERETALT
jgi:uncharacterized membrane protein YphA (DoxX/SURF4 family)